MIGRLATDFSVEKVCGVLSVSRSGFYAWKAGKTHHLNGHKAEVGQHIEQIFTEHRRRYGTRRIQAELKALGFQVGRHQIRKCLREKGLKAIQPRSFVPKTTHHNPALERSPNLLLERELPKAIDQVWVGDITYIPLTDGRWLYLAVWMDLFSRRIVGWHLGRTLEAVIVIRSFEKALTWRQPAPGMLVHSDGGKQYQAQAFRTLLRPRGLEQSMTRVENHYDNSFIESLFSRFKAELLQGKAFTDYQQAHAAIFEYIEAYYNRKRRHSSILYMSPEAFEKNQVKEL